MYAHASQDYRRDFSAVADDVLGHCAVLNDELFVDFVSGVDVRDAMNRADRAGRVDGLTS